MSISWPFQRVKRLCIKNAMKNCWETAPNRDSTRKVQLWVVCCGFDSIRFVSFRFRGIMATIFLNFSTWGSDSKSICRIDFECIHLCRQHFVIIAVRYCMEYSVKDWNAKVSVTFKFINNSQNRNTISLNLNRYQFRRFNEIFAIRLKELSLHRNYHWKSHIVHECDYELLFWCVRFYFFFFFKSFGWFESICWMASKRQHFNWPQAKITINAKWKGDCN